MAKHLQSTPSTFLRKQNKNDISLFRETQASRHSKFHH